MANMILTRTPTTADLDDMYLELDSFFNTFSAFSVGNFVAEVEIIDSHTVELGGRLQLPMSSDWYRIEE